MGKGKQVRLGKVVKKKDEENPNKFTLSIRQHGKLSGSDSRKLKAQLEAVCHQFIVEKYTQIEASV